MSMDKMKHLAHNNPDNRVFAFVYKILKYGFWIVNVKNAIQNSNLRVVRVAERCVTAVYLGVAS
jgi:hypothetical protein